jgi:hypothetical protein
MTTKIENNSRMSEDKKEKILAQLEALKDIVNAKLDKTSDKIDVESLLN